MAVTQSDDLILKISSGTHAWRQIGAALQSQLGMWYEYTDVQDWFKSQNATGVPLADRVLNYYALVFDTPEDRMEFVLTWL